MRMEQQMAIVKYKSDIVAGWSILGAKRKILLLCRQEGIIRARDWFEACVFYEPTLLLIL